MFDDTLEERRAFVLSGGTPVRQQARWYGEKHYGQSLYTPMYGWKEMEKRMCKCEGREKETKSVGYVSTRFIFGMQIKNIVLGIFWVQVIRVQVDSGFELLV